MSSGRLCLDEMNIFWLMISFLEQRGLHCSAATLERESGCSAIRYSEPVHQLRSALLRGRWTQAQELVLSLLPEMEARRALFEVSRQKYVELLCIYQELGNELFEDLGNAVAVCFSEMTGHCEDPEEREKLRGLASLARLEDDPVYSNWNPFSSRKQCFEKVRAILERVSQNECLERSPSPSPERLLTLLAKGVLYEACEEYCRRKALARSNSEVKFQFGSLMDRPSYNSEDPRKVAEDVTWISRSETDCIHDSENSEVNSDGATKEIDLKLLNCDLFSWLQTVPWVSLTKEFVQFPLRVEVKEFKKPQRSEGWTETILEGVDQTAEFQDVKERFWNDKISKNLVVDAPEILKRAEEVVNRWEAKRRMQNSRTSVDPHNGCENYLRARKEFGDEMDRVTSTVRKELISGDNRVTKSKSSRSRSIYTSSESQGTAAHKRVGYVSEEVKENLFSHGDCDRDIKANLFQQLPCKLKLGDNIVNVSPGTIDCYSTMNVESGDNFMELKIPNTVEAKHVKGNNKGPSGSTGVSGIGTGSKIDGTAHVSKDQRGNPRAQKTTYKPKTFENQDDIGFEGHSFDDDPITYERQISLTIEGNEILKPEIPEKRTTNDDFSRNTSGDGVGKNFTKSGIGHMEHTSCNTTEMADDVAGRHFAQNVVSKNFFERKQYMTEMLRDKEILRRNLLQILKQKSADEYTHEKETTPSLG